MRRSLPIAFLTFALTAVAVAPAFAQDFRLSLQATMWSSSHTDEAAFSFSRRLSRQVTPDPKIAGQRRDLQWAWMGEARVGVDWGGTGGDAGSVFQVLGGLRATTDSLLKYPLFAELKVGVIHFPGSNSAVIHPVVGLTFDRPSSTWGWFASVGTPMAFFGNKTQFGLEGAIGFTFPNR